MHGKFGGRGGGGRWVFLVNAGFDEDVVDGGRWPEVFNISKVSRSDEQCVDFGELLYIVLVSSS